MISVRRRRAPIAAAVATVLLGAGALIGLGADAASGPATLSGATLEWAFNAEMNTGAFDGSCNHLSAGRTDGSPAMYTGTDRDVTIVKRTAGGGYATISDWTTRCLDANGQRVTVSGAARLGLVVRLTGGDGTHDPVTGATTLQWSGSFSANMYDELVPQWFTDPKLVIDAAGHATLSATLAGYASSLDDPDVREATPPIPDVVVARLDVAAAGTTGFTATPRYSGVTYDSLDTPQVRNGASWGAWPAELVAAMERTGTGAYWYSTGSVADSRKAPSPITVAFGPMFTDPTTTTTTTSPTPTSTTPTSTTPTSTTPTTTSTTTPTTTTTPSSTTTPTTTTAPTTAAPVDATRSDAGAPSTAASVESGSVSSGAETASTEARRSIPGAASGATSATATSATATSGSKASSAAPSTATGTNPATALTAVDAVDAAASAASGSIGRNGAADTSAAIRTVDAVLRYSAVTAEYRPNINLASPGSVAITYTVQNIGAVTLAAKGSARVAPSLGSAVSAATSVTAIAPGRSRTVTQVVEGVWPGFGTESVLRLTPYVPASPDVDLQRASIAARTSATVWPWQQFALVALLVGGGVATGTRLLRRHRRSAS